MRLVLPDSFEFVGPMARKAKALDFNRPNWWFPDDCLSTSVKQWAVEQGQFPKVAYARLVVCWYYNTPGTKVRIVHCDTGPSDIKNLGPTTVSWIDPEALGHEMNKPIVSSSGQLKDALNALSDAGAWRQLAIQIAGQGVINRASLEVLWEFNIPSNDEIAAMIEAATEPLKARIEALENPQE